MSDELTRRELLAALGAVALGSFVVPGKPRDLLFPSAPRTRVSSFALTDVRLLDGLFLDAQRRNARYLLSLEPDRMLHNFRVNAGLPPKAPVYGGWESEEPWVGIRCHGHTLGHYLSAVAMMAASTDDVRFRERTDYIVSELRACQRARGDGLTCAFPDGSKPLDDAVAGRPFTGVPWYTMHKIFAGVRDAHTHAKSADALSVLTALSEWTWSATRGMSDVQFQRMLDTEHGGMTEVLADASVLANEPKYLALAERFVHRKVVTPLAEWSDRLDGLHANTQIPKIIGAQRIFERTGSKPLGEAAQFFWRTVAAQRSFATGGHGDNEHFFPVGDFAKHIGSAKTMETCCTHNMLRLTRDLFMRQPSSAHADYYERALYNGILASQDPDSGMMTYFQATRPGYVRLYHTPVDSFWCCTGTGMENHAKYGDSIYFKGDRTLYVNLFIPSTVRWHERGLTLTQTTRFPDADTTRLTIEARRPTNATIAIRRPAWCAAMQVTVNGRRVSADADDTGYVAVRRNWQRGDVVEVQLPMTLRTEQLPGAPDMVAFAYGPVVLAGLLGREGVTPADQIIRNERESGTMLNEPIEVPTLTGDASTVLSRVRPVAGDPLMFELADSMVRLGPYFRCAHERYVLYWKTA
ncbi:MAG: beta-L-arabinofuranosidase domain-containing protein [bacterium]